MAEISMTGQDLHQIERYRPHPSTRPTPLVEDQSPGPNSSLTQIEAILSKSQLTLT
ncbi:Hypothetical protein CINCED_3A015591 [Cinara cedri]|uniref:Uncharacterized protein n=1 Tax=Cinara cedri TaxID=506608 RepID=A0A5E4MZU3_9HEMI|nr:Hypothetical protein CINCED_3A015591 [Cinara cedri]